MLNKLKKLFSRSATGALSTPSSHNDTFEPEHPLYIVGDVHGCFELLEQKIKAIEAHSAAHEIDDKRLILLGDYADRGPQSAQVLELIYTLQTNTPEQIICLMGNHEKMMLEFIDDPVGRGNRWLQFGGADTLESYGISKPSKNADVEELTKISLALEDAMPDGLQAWLRALPLTFQSGNVVCVHAAMDPTTSPTEQSDRVMLWGHKDFMTTERNDAFWIAHGHTIVKSASCQKSRIALDTGAYKSGRLSVAAVTNGHCTFL